MVACDVEEICNMTNGELTKIVFDAGQTIAAAQGQWTSAEEEAKRIFLAAYGELLRRPAQTGNLRSLGGASQLAWRCSYAGFEMTHAEYGTVAMIRDLRSPSGYRIKIIGPGVAQTY